MPAVRAILKLGAFLVVSAVGAAAAGGARLLGLFGGSAGRWWGQRACTRVQAAWARANLAVLGVALDARGPGGERRPPAGVGFVVANHTSYLDVLVLSSLVPSRFVASHDIAGWPLFGFLSRLAGTIFIDRARRRELVAIAGRMRASVDQGLAVVLFPEGTSTAGVEVLPFHSSLLEPAADERIACLPVTLRYATPGERLSPAFSVSWWGGMPLWPHIWRLLGLRRIEARARWGEPVASADRRELAERLRAAVCEGFEPYALEPAPDWAADLRARSPRLAGGSTAEPTAPTTPSTPTT